MDVIAICLVCQLTAQLPALDTNNLLVSASKNLEQPIQLILPGQAASQLEGQTRNLMASLPEGLSTPLADVPSAGSPQPFWVRWWQALSGKSNSSLAAPKPSALSSEPEQLNQADQDETDQPLKSVNTPVGVTESSLSVVDVEAEDGQAAPAESSVAEADTPVSEPDSEPATDNMSPPPSLVSSDDMARLAGRVISSPKVSPDVELLQLASTELLGREPVLAPDTFEPATRAVFNPDGTVTLRVFVGNSKERLTVIGDFNNWGNDVDLAPYTLYPSAEDSTIHEATLPPGDYHRAQYRLRDQEGRERLDMGSPLFSTPAFNQRFYEHREDDNLNSVFWKPQPIPEDELASPIDLRGKQLVIAETDLVSLTLKWECAVTDSSFWTDRCRQYWSAL